MSKALDKAREQQQAGQLKRAVATLWEVTFAGDDAEDEARGTIALATRLRDSTEGNLRTECEQHIARAESALRVEEQTTAERRVDQYETEVREDPARLARWARDAGLTWLEIESSVDLIAAPMRAAMAAKAEGRSPDPPACAIDAVEAEGWHLEQVTRGFRPTRVLASPFGAADLISGGQEVEGEERCQYLFRRVG